ncbi:MAG TPA: sensor histidine kinase KdpD [Anaerolineae bacterium]|nr:sensor histidine kinase KdpD [Anaerolineae bacterium]
MSQEHARPNPDELLSLVQKEEARQSRGKLKIFLGYVAGVGKTYAMLEAAHRRRAEGLEVVVAYIETHGRVETESLLTGLELISRRQLDYRGVILTEMDLDAVLARRPGLALVDELAHTNAPGSRHTRRFQDVLELLDAGIDVYTTVNIQHLESLNDVVAQITGVTVRETVPDYLLDEAHEIELIDLPIDELLQRLAEGKVYVPEQAGRAIEKFFRPGNLAALRELALRRAADRIDEQMRAYMQTHAIAGPWPAGERLLVCVSPSPLSERLVRAARRLAVRLNAEWFAIYIETPGQARLTEAARGRVAHNLHLAESLGAKVRTVTGHSAAEAIVEFAKSHNISKIVAGKPLRPRWQELWRGSVVDQIIRRSGDLDIYVISSAPEQPEPELKWARLRRPHPWPRYGWSAGLVVLATLLGFPLRPFVNPINLVMLYLLVVVIAALYLGRRPAIVASMLSVVAFNFIFVPPYYTYVVSDAQFLLTFGALLLVGIVISTLTAQARDQARAAQRRETLTASLYELSRNLAAAAELEKIAQIVVSHIHQIFDEPAIILLTDPSRERLRPCFNNPEFAFGENEAAVAMWTFQHSQPAGHGTDTLAGVTSTYLPLKTAQSVIGVLGVHRTKDGEPLAAEQWRLLESFANQAAQAIRRVQLAEEAGQAQLLRETERLQTALLNSISHDLRTPLASITGALSSLRDDEACLDASARSILISTACEQADRLNSLVGNLLDMTRLESGAMKVKKEPCEVQDVIGVALSQLANRLEDRALNIEVPADLPLVPMDFVLMAQVLVNLLDNALKYSPLDRPVTVGARVTPTELLIDVMDQGLGIPEPDLPRVFDKFYRVARANGIGGTGLGLSISKGIVEAHGGRIWAKNNPAGGPQVTIALPLAATAVAL